MKFYSLQYSLKVWMCSVLLAPVLFFAIGFFLTTDHCDSAGTFILGCLVSSFFEMLFSVLTWLTFWMVTEVIAGLVDNKLLRKSLACATGMLLTLATFAMFPFFDSFTTLNNDYLLMLCNCVCIGGGALYFHLSGPAATKSAATIHPRSNGDHELSNI